MLVNWYHICLSLPSLPLSGTEPLSFSCLQTTLELWRATWPSANHGTDMTSPAPDNNRQTPNKLGRRKAGEASNVLLLSTPYLPSNFQVQWKVSWTSQEFSEVWKTERERKTVRERIWFRKMMKHFFHETALSQVPAESTWHTLNPSSSAPRAITTDHVQCNVSKALGPAASSWGPASFYGNCLFASSWFYFLSQLLWLNIHIKPEAITQTENSETDQIHVKSFVVISLPPEHGFLPVLIRVNTGTYWCQSETFP